MLDKFFKAKLKSLFAKTPKKIAIAVSGGADSMCLAALCQKNSKNIEIIALIVDHGLREESSKEAALVKKRLEKLSIKAEVLVWQGKKPKSNIQEHARNARYTLLTNYCSDNKIHHLLVAHNANDQAETLMLRIFRGSGIDGISGIKESTKMNGINILRPLLEVSRQDIEKHLNSQKIKWVDDPSNKDEKYERVKIRNLLATLEDKDLWVERLNLLANNAQRSSNFINTEVTRIYDEHVHKDRLGFMSIPLDTFTLLHEEVALKLLVKILGRFSGDLHQPRLKNLLSCRDAITHKQDVCLAGVEIKHIKGAVYFIREYKAIKDKVVDGVWDNRFVVKEQSVEPLGEDGWQKIKKQIANKTWPHVKVLYSLPSIKTKDTVRVPYLLSTADSFLCSTWRTSRRL